MFAFGTKRTSRHASPMSAFVGKADSIACQTWNFANLRWCGNRLWRIEVQIFGKGVRVGDKDDSSRKTSWAEGTDDSDRHRRIIFGNCWHAAIVGPVGFPSEWTGTRGLPSGCSEVLPSRVATESRRHAEHYGLSTGQPDKDQSRLSERAYEERSINLDAVAWVTDLGF